MGRKWDFRLWSENSAAAHTHVHTHILTVKYTLEEPLIRVLKVSMPPPLPPGWTRRKWSVTEKPSSPPQPLRGPHLFRRDEWQPCTTRVRMQILYMHTKESTFYMHSWHLIKNNSCIHIGVFSVLSRELFLCLDVDRRGSVQNEAESHEKLALRIEKDVVSDTGHYITRLLSLSHIISVLFTLHPWICLPQQILNCALDDIEIFVARLQKAAEAFSQLNHRNKSKKNKKKGPAGLSPFLLMWWHECSDNMFILLTLPCLCLFASCDLGLSSSDACVVLVGSLGFC